MSPPPTPTTTTTPTHTHKTDAAFTSALATLGMTKKALLANVNLMSQVSP